MYPFFHQEVERLQTTSTEESRASVGVSVEIQTSPVDEMFVRSTEPWSRMLDEHGKTAADDLEKGRQQHEREHKELQSLHAKLRQQLEAREAAQISATEGFNAVREALEKQVATPQKARHASYHGMQVPAAVVQSAHRVGS